MSDQRDPGDEMLEQVIQWHMDGPELAGDNDRLLVEKTELQARAAAAEAERDRLAGEAAVLRAALEMVEWIYAFTRNRTTRTGERAPGYCPWCKLGEPDHASDCPRQQALAGTPLSAAAGRVLADVREWHEWLCRNDTLALSAAEDKLAVDWLAYRALLGGSP